MNIPKYAQVVADRLTENGFEAYFVGGCVRDWIMGKEPNDFDITTNALPGEIKSVFSDFKTVLTGEKHGTVTVVSDGENIEVTTYRVDGEYKDSRHPETVSFTGCVEEDLSRRDFTINAICCNGDFVDPFGGRQDIKSRIIRTVGDAKRRFNEDALRIMRALRFAATLGFEIEENTKKSIRENAVLLKNVSAERIFAEFSKLIMGEYSEKVLMEYSDVIGVFAPCILPCVGFDQKNAYHIYDVYTHMVKAVTYAPYELRIKLAAFFHDVGKPECFTFDEKGGHFKGHAARSAEITNDILSQLKADNDTKNTVVSLVREHQREILPEKKYVKRFLGKYSYEFFDLLMCVCIADIKAHSEKGFENLKDIEKLIELRNEIENENACISIKGLAINGDDLKQMGFAEGRMIGEVLNLLLESVVEGETENTREALAEKVVLIKEKRS